MQNATAKNIFLDINMKEIERFNEKKVTGSRGVGAPRSGTERDPSASLSVNCGSEQMDVQACPAKRATGIINKGSKIAASFATEEDTESEDDVQTLRGNGASPQE